MTETEQWRDALYNACVEAIDRGWSVIPLSIEGKKPLISWKKYQTENTTQEELDEWFEQGVKTESGNTVPLFNMALVTGSISGVIVLDCDNEKAVQFALKNDMTSPFVVSTARGKHFYFAHPMNGQRFANKVGNTARDWYPIDGLDLRGDGGYVVMPPSMKVKEGKAEHIYHMEVGYGLSLDDLSDFPWKGEPSGAEMLVEGEFTFGSLSLANVRIPNPEDTLPVAKQVERRVAHLGRKLREGDSTDLWLVKFIGQKVRQGITGEDLNQMVRSFHDEYFDSGQFTNRETLDWINTKIRSVVDMDKRQYPSDYDDKGNRVTKSEPKVNLGRLVPIRGTDLDRLIDTLGRLRIGRTQLYQQRQSHKSLDTTDMVSRSLCKVCWCQWHQAKKSLDLSTESLQRFCILTTTIPVAQSCIVLETLSRCLAIAEITLTCGLQP